MPVRPIRLVPTSFARRTLLGGIAGLAAASPSRAQDRASGLRCVTAGAVNTLDPTMAGGTAEAGALSTCFYDRLLRFGQREDPGGFSVFDFERTEGELAERVEAEPGGTAFTFTLRPGACFHDGTAVTATDVKWSLDRAVRPGSLSRAQLATGSLVAPEQFTVLDERRIRLVLDRPDRLALPNLATSYAPILNSRLAQRHASADDPWAENWLKENTAGSGAFRVQAATLGRQVSLVRNPDWAGGPQPGFERLLLQTTAEASTRAALVARGDAELATGLGAAELRGLERDGTARVVGHAGPTGFGALVFNTRMAPFDQVAVRQALSLAVPYEAIFSAALDGRGARLFGASWQGEPPTGSFPQPLPLRSDLEEARSMLRTAGLSAGFGTRLAFGASRAGFAEPAAALIQESFGQLGVRVEIDKLTDPAMAAAVTAKRLPMLLERSLALFPSTEYFFRIFLSGDTRWNFASWADPEVDALLPQARFEPDSARVEAVSRRLVGILAREVPMATLFQPGLDLALARGVDGLVIGPAGYPDLRALRRTGR